MRDERLSLSIAANRKTISRMKGRREGENKEITRNVINRVMEIIGRCHINNQ
jgi:hypothetical protein